MPRVRSTNPRLLPHSKKSKKPQILRDVDGRVRWDDQSLIEGGGGRIRRTGGMQPFGSDGMEGRRYGPMLPFNTNNLGGMRPFTCDPMTGKPSGTPMTGRFPKKREGAQDILHHLDGQPELVANYMWDLIMDRVPDPTGSEIVSILNALPIGSRLQYSWLDGQPSIPLNTASWHGAFQLRTAYTSGSIVTDAGGVFIYITDIPATNTTRPASDSRAEALDVGSPLDITNVAKAGLTFTFTRRTGTFSLTISPTDIYGAIGNMTPTQLMGLRNLIGAAPVVHNHDDRYYTETESDGRFAPRSTISATVANVLTALQGMNTTQEGQARNAIGISLERLERVNWNPSVRKTRTDSTYSVSNAFYYRIGNNLIAAFFYGSFQSNNNQITSFYIRPPIGSFFDGIIFTNANVGDVRGSEFRIRDSSINPLKVVMIYGV